MLPLLMTLFSSPKVRAAGLYLCLLVGLMLGLRWYTNKAYSDGRSEGVSSALVESVHSSEISWKADLNALQKQFETSQQLSLVSAQAAVAAASRADNVLLESARTRQAITQQAAATPLAALPDRLVENDARLLNHTDNTEALQRALLESQLNTQELQKSITSLSNDWKEYKAATDTHIAALQDQAAATSGQLKVMTQERDSYKASFESAIKKRGCGTFKKILTLGVCR